jgi:hypothetical protein
MARSDAMKAFEAAFHVSEMVRYALDVEVYQPIAPRIVKDANKRLGRLAKLPAKSL